MQAGFAAPASRTSAPADGLCGHPEHALKKVHTWVAAIGVALIGGALLYAGLHREPNRISAA